MTQSQQLRKLAARSATAFLLAALCVFPLYIDKFSNLGVVKFTGVNTFEGVHGYEDFVSPEITEDSTWMEDYAVIPFGIGPMSLLII